MEGQMPPRAPIRREASLWKTKGASLRFSLLSTVQGPEFDAQHTRWKTECGGKHGKHQFWGEGWLEARTRASLTTQASLSGKLQRDPVSKKPTVP